jgi:hypothetical protein
VKELEPSASFVSGVFLVCFYFILFFAILRGLRNMDIMKARNKYLRCLNANLPINNHTSEENFLKKVIRLSTITRTLKIRVVNNSHNLNLHCNSINEFIEFEFVCVCVYTYMGGTHVHLHPCS